MEAILKFTLPEDRCAFAIASTAMDWALTVSDIDKFMRWKEMVAWAVSNGCDEIVSKVPERDFYHLRG